MDIPTRITVVTEAIEHSEEYLYKYFKRILEDSPPCVSRRQPYTAIRLTEAQIVRAVQSDQRIPARQLMTAQQLDGVGPERRRVDAKRLIVRRAKRVLPFNEVVLRFQLVNVVPDKFIDDVFGHACARALAGRMPPEISIEREAPIEGEDLGVKSSRLCR